jgi:ESX secretion-associated protein EspG
VQFTLTATEFEVAWGVLQLGDLPLIFRVRISRRGATAQERAQLVASTMDGLRGRGLAGARGPSGDLADALSLLARYRWAVDARMDLQREVRALGAATGSAAVLAVLDASTVTITPCTPHRLPAHVARLAGDATAAHGGRSINVRAEALLAAAGRVAGTREPHRLAGELVAEGVPAAEASTIARLNAGMLDAGQFAGQFGAEAADRDGTLRRAPCVIGFCDTRDGRWAQLRTTGHDGKEWITFTPAGPAVLTAMIADLLRECGVRVG